MDRRLQQNRSPLFPRNAFPKGVSCPQPSDFMCLEIWGAEHPYLRNLTVRAGYKKAVIAVAHRLCQILFAILRDKTAFDPSKLAVEKGAFEVTTTRVYRLKRAATTSG